MPAPVNSISNSNHCNANITPPCHTNKSAFPAGDDILLIGVLILLLHEECNDTALILIIGFLLFSGFVS